MAIEKYTVRDGIFTQERVRGDAEDLKTFLKDYMSKFGKAEPMIEEYRKKGYEILERYGYPTDWLILYGEDLEGEGHPSAVRDVASMLMDFWFVEENIITGNASAAAFFMGRAINAAMRAQIRPVEPIAFQGAAFKTAQRKKAKKERTRDGMTPAQRRARDAEIWTAFQKWVGQGKTTNSFAIREGKKRNLKPVTIHKILKKFSDKNPSMS